jgi:clan AA aspartic protease (TIGR02281 family)
MKNLFILLIIIISLNLKTFAKTSSDYNALKNAIKEEQYSKMMDIYLSTIKHTTKIEYQNYIFKQIIKLIKTSPQKALLLVDEFLDIESNNDFAKYLKSRIYFSNSKYKLSLEVLYDLQNYPLSDEFLTKVQNDIQNTAYTFINILKEKSNTEELKQIIEFFSLYNDTTSIEYTKNSLLKLFEENKDENPFQALNILNDLKNMYNTEDFTIKINSKTNYFIQSFITTLQRNDDLKNMKKLFEILLNNNYENHLQKLQISIKKLEEKNNIAKIHNKVIPLEKYGQHYIINATINNTAIKLMIDTGASVSVINQSLKNNFTHTSINKNIQVSTAAGIAKNHLVKVDNFSIDDIVINEYKLMISHIEISKNFDGLLGMNFLSKFKFFIDQENSVLVLN